MLVIPPVELLEPEVVLLPVALVVPPEVPLDVLAVLVVPPELPDPPEVGEVVPELPDAPVDVGVDDVDVAGFVDEEAEVVVVVGAPLDDVALPVLLDTAPLESVCSKPGRPAEHEAT